MSHPLVGNTFKRGRLLGWVPSVTNEGPFFDPLTTSASELSQMLNSGEVNSVQILNQCYRQILKYNDYLGAVLQLAPGAIDRARTLDDQRAKGMSFGPLHGIPVLLKDNIGVHAGMEMPTTGCNVGLSGSFAKQNAPVVDRLIEAGAIIMGKATMSEMMWFKGEGIGCGWSSLHGQSQNPYIKGGDNPDDGLGGHSSTDGSSAGSAVTVAAGMAPVAIGTETFGSLVLPGVRQALWAFKPRLGSVPNAGIIPISSDFDIAGPMCKTVQDTVNVLWAIADTGALDLRDELGLTSAMKGEAGWQDLRIGTLPLDFLGFDPDFMVPVPEATDQIRSKLTETYNRIKELAAAYYDNVTLRPESEFTLNGKTVQEQILQAHFQPQLDGYLANTQGSEIRSTEDLAAWNKAHADLALPPRYPSQSLIEDSIASDLESNDRAKYLKHFAEVGECFEAALEKHDINVIIGSGDSRFCNFSAASGFPVCSIPTGSIEYLGRRVGLQAMARTESTLVTLMSAIEASFPPREPPSAFLDHGEDLNN